MLSPLFALARNIIFLCTCSYQWFISFCIEHHTDRNFEKAPKPSTSKSFEDLDESLEESEAI